MPRLLIPISPQKTVKFTPHIEPSSIQFFAESITRKRPPLIQRTNAWGGRDWVTIDAFSAFVSNNTLWLLSREYNRDWKRPFIPAFYESYTSICAEPLDRWCSAGVEGNSFKIPSSIPINRPTRQIRHREICRDHKRVTRAPFPMRRTKKSN